MLNDAIKSEQHNGLVAVDIKEADKKEALAAWELLSQFSDLINNERSPLVLDACVKDSAGAIQPSEFIRVFKPSFNACFADLLARAHQELCAEAPLNGRAPETSRSNNVGLTLNDAAMPALESIKQKIEAAVIAVQTRLSESEVSPSKLLEREVAVAERESSVAARESALSTKEARYREDSTNLLAQNRDLLSRIAKVSEDERAATSAGKRLAERQKSVEQAEEEAVKLQLQLNAGMADHGEALVRRIVELDMRVCTMKVRSDKADQRPT